MTLALLISPIAAASAVSSSPTDQLTVHPEAQLAQSTSPTYLLPDPALDAAFEMNPDLAKALADQQLDDAIQELQHMDRTTLGGPALGDHAFLLAWCLIHTDRAAEAVSLIPQIQASQTAPAPYRDLVLGELMLEDGRFVQAAELLDTVDPSAQIWTRARLARAAALFEAGRTADSLAIYEDLARRPDPAPGGELALWALVQRRGPSSPQARPELLRLYAHYPTTSQGQQATAILGDDIDATAMAWRADALMAVSSYKSVIALLASEIDGYGRPAAGTPEPGLASTADCVAWYAYGRTQFKRNNITLAAQILEPAGQRCVGVDDDRGAKALYIAGKALERKKDWQGAARVYEQLPALYPEHSMADDGYALAGIAWQQAGQDDKAVQRWTAQVGEYPDGDLAAEGFWRLAWTAYRNGDPEAAISWAEASIWQVPLETDPRLVQAAHYWSARWRVYPDVSDPTALNPDSEARARGLDLLQQLCEQFPTSFYAILAANRLIELAPERLAGITRPPVGEDLGGWHVRPEWAQSPTTQWGLALGRLGLIPQALAELEADGLDAMTPSERAVEADLVARADPTAAHDRLHAYLLHHPAETLGQDRDRLVRRAFPNLYWDEVQLAVADDDFDPRIFHALVREESSFNPDARSWAGARGLSQLMPKTAQHVAGQLGLHITTAQLADPALNLRIGGHYYASLVRRFDGNIFLSTPSYNAGPGNVGKWLALDPTVPTDEFVESIPFRETRHYVKRVMGTWQLYRITYDDGPVFPDLSAFNHHAQD